MRTINKKIVNAWTTFFKEEITDELPDLSGINFQEFGEVMEKVIHKLGKAESVLWEGKFPSGTEDRTWYRTYLYRTGHKAYVDMPSSLDNAHVFRILESFSKIKF